jgi:ATP-binding cassette subfamily B (MDR/TAP) protein 1
MSSSIEKAGGSSPATAIETKKSIDRSTASDSTIALRTKAQGSPLSSSHKNDDDALYAHLPENEKQILKKQLDALEVKVSFFALFRYSSRMDILVIVVSAICAIAAGAALPLFTVRSAVSVAKTIS